MAKRPVSQTKAGNYILRSTHSVTLSFVMKLIIGGGIKRDDTGKRWLAPSGGDYTWFVNRLTERGYARHGLNDRAEASVLGTQMFNGYKLVAAHRRG